MTGSVIGLSDIKKGSYEGHDYSNRYVHVMYIDDLDPIDGMKAACVKVKSDTFDRLKLKTGMDVNLGYDRFGHLAIYG